MNLFQNKSFNFLLPLIVGFALSLLLFKYIPALQVSYTIPASWPEILTAVGTLATGIIALVLALWGKSINELFYKPDMNLIGHHENKQVSDSGVQGHTRLKFINNGKSVAKNVNVYIEAIKDGSFLRGDFLSVPLLWTHDGRYVRNFPPKEEWFLDLCIKDKIDNHQFPILVLGPGQGVKNYQNLYEGKTTLFLKISDESGKIKKYKVALQWQIGEPYVRVHRINEIL